MRKYNSIKDMVEKYGMGEGIIPSQIDSASLIDEAVEDVETFLFKMKNSITEVAKILLDQESITKEELKKVVGEFL
jgi:ATP-dependent Zn protease